MKLARGLNRFYEERKDDQQFVEKLIKLSEIAERSKMLVKIDERDQSIMLVKKGQKIGVYKQPAGSLRLSNNWNNKYKDKDVNIIDINNENNNYILAQANKDGSFSVFN